MKKHNAYHMALKILGMLAGAGIHYENKAEAVARFTLLIDAKLKQGAEK